ncbi:hypothetical protein GCM10010442_74020 [Kitasatospora kifunensis]
MTARASCRYRRASRIRYSAVTAVVGRLFQRALANGGALSPGDSFFRWATPLRHRILFAIVVGLVAIVIGIELIGRHPRAVQQSHTGAGPRVRRVLAFHRQALRHTWMRPPRVSWRLGPPRREGDGSRGIGRTPKPHVARGTEYRQATC